MIYDCFIFFDELDLYVGQFVLVETDETYQGAEKPLYYQENRKRFEKFVHKII